MDKLMKYSVRFFLYALMIVSLLACGVDLDLVGEDATGDVVLDGENSFGYGDSLDAVLSDLFDDEDDSISSDAIDDNLDDEDGSRSGDAHGGDFDDKDGPSSGDARDDDDKGDKDKKDKDKKDKDKDKKDKNEDATIDCSIPDTRAELFECIREAIQKNGNTASLNHIDIKNIKSLRGALSPQYNLEHGTFSNPEGTKPWLEDFNGDISEWDTSHITDMGGMFYAASAFNQPIGHWDTGNVTNMIFMFTGAHAFNQPIESWDTSKVTNMRAMFFAALEFNQPLGKWNTSNVEDMVGLFGFAKKFNQPIGRWNTEKVIGMNAMFLGAEEFNQDLTEWRKPPYDMEMFKKADSMEDSNKADWMLDD